MAEAAAASWLLLECLQERVQGITRAAGFMTDLGTGPVVLDDDTLDDDTPGTVIQAGLISVTSSSGSAVNFDMDITVEFSVKRDSAAGAQHGVQQMHRCLLDLARALLFKDLRELPRFVRTFEQTGAQLATGDDERGATYLVAQVTARAGLTQIHQPAT
ncbi:hypothetical protein H9645_03630 [Luteimonas sp. Sa2BVA3]|uniref:Uncharacterized protein n=1 Tax=Luteimonas colneyensis TaxID=2762230 RepID=A0ABR8UGG7_9GAMM|nr:hypothetical protein [Luteimonas colneyensis]MBD7987112.1 hypothetical protein [Luteimonas colneyensis]